MRRVGSTLRAVVLGLLAGACGPEAEPVLDRDRILREYCEMALTCVENPAKDLSECIAYFGDVGVREDGGFAEQGCLDEELIMLDCLSGLTCEEFDAWIAGPDAPCSQERQDVFDAGCQHVF